MKALAPMKLFIASDHGGFSLKTHLQKGFPLVEWMDLGCDSQDSVDYPYYADKLVSHIQEQDKKEKSSLTSLQVPQGVLICGSGQGMAMRANKHHHIRAALCWNEISASLARQHNNANILCLGGRILFPPLSEKILKIFLDTPFEGGRHQRRINQVKAPTS